MQRTGDVYEFLTDVEKDVENEIKATEIDETAINEIAAKILFDEIIRDTKIRHEDNQQDYAFSRKLDSSVIGREHELVINIISPFNEFHDDDATLVSQSMGKPELLMILPSDQRLLSDLNLYAKTEKFIRHNNNSALAESIVSILYERGLQNIQRKSDIRQRLEKLLSGSKAIVNGSEVTGISSEPRSRVMQVFNHLVRSAYPNLKMLKIVFKEDSVYKIIMDQGDDLFRHDDDTLSEGEQELLSSVRRRQKNGERPSISSILSDFGKRPYGWYQAATLANIAKLFMRGKVELRSDSNILEKDSVLDHLSNNRLFNNTIVYLQEEFDSISVQKLKSFHQEFFDENNIGTDAKDVAQRFQNKLKQEIAVLEETCQRKLTFPFLSKLTEPIEKLKAWADKSYSIFLKELPSFQDEWMAAKEDVIDPIRKFVHGQQGEVYQQIRDFVNYNRENLNDIIPEDAAKLSAFLASDTPYRENALHQSKTLTDTLQKAVELHLKEVVVTTKTGPLEKLVWSN